MNTTPSETPSTQPTSSTEPVRGTEPAATTLTVEPTPTADRADAAPAWGTPIDQGHAPAGGAQEPGPTYGPTYGHSYGPTYGPGHRAGHAPSGHAPYGSVVGPDAGPTGPTDDRTPGQDFFNGIRRLGVSRSGTARWAGGVCGGLAERWNVSPIAVRLLFVLFGLLFGAGLFLYGLLWMFMPQQDGRIHAQQLLRGTLSAGFAGALVAMLAGAPFGLAADGEPRFLPILVVAAVVYLIVRRHRAHATR